MYLLLKSFEVGFLWLNGIDDALSVKNYYYPLDVLIGSVWSWSFSMFVKVEGYFSLIAFWLVPKSNKLLFISKCYRLFLFWMFYDEGEIWDLRLTDDLDSFPCFKTEVWVLSGDSFVDWLKRIEDLEGT